MLKSRILTAIPLALFVIWGVLAFPAWLFLIVSAAVMLWAAWEWSGLMGLKTLQHQAWYVSAMAACMLLILLFSIPSTVILTIGLLAWLDPIYFIFAKQRQHNLPSRINSIWYRAWLGGIIILPCWVGLFSLRSGFYGPIWLLYALSIVWMADSAAYFAGRFIGKHPLASEVSPKKTWEGVAGGVLGALLLGVIWNISLAIPFNHWAIILFLVMLAAAVSVLGDLFESLMKRLANVKDSGRLLPGHGGILDRIDGMTAAVPLLALCSLILL